jgi:hypothetical protein
MSELTTYTDRIVAEHEAAQAAAASAVEHAIRCGELLIEAKAAMPHGSFGDYVATLPFAATTARGYMRLARLDDAKRQRVADFSLRDALAEIAEPRPPADTGCAPGEIYLPRLREWLCLLDQHGAIGTALWHAMELRSVPPRTVGAVLWCAAKGGPALAYQIRLQDRLADACAWYLACVADDWGGRGADYAATLSDPATARDCVAHGRGCDEPTMLPTVDQAITALIGLAEAA